MDELKMQKNIKLSYQVSYDKKKLSDYVPEPVHQGSGKLIDEEIRDRYHSSALIARKLFCSLLDINLLLKKYDSILNKKSHHSPQNYLAMFWNELLQYTESRNHRKIQLYFAYNYILYIIEIGHHQTIL